MAEENENAQQNGSGSSSSILDTLMSKELIIPAALSAVGAVAAAKGPDLLRHLGNATEEKGEEQAERMGAKAAEGAKSSLTGGGMLGKVASKALPGGGGGGGSGQK